VKILNKIKRLFRLDGTGLPGLVELGLSAELSYKKLAVDSCVNLIASTLAGCEFVTFEEGREVRKDNYYLLNVRPNINQSGGVFWRSAVSKLLKANEVLIIMQDNNLYVADSFSVEKYAVYPNIYDNVTVGSLSFNRSFHGDDVLHIKLNDENIRRLIDGIYADYGKLIASAVGVYKRKNALRLLVEEPAVSSMQEEERKKRKNLYEKDFRTWIEADGVGAVLPLPLGMKVHERANSDRIQHTSRDMRALIDDIMDYAATAYKVPVRLLKGDVAELNQAVNALIIFTIKPLAKLITDEINAKMYSKAGYLRRTYVKINTRRIAMVDVATYATAADKLFAAGIATVNDNRRLLDMEPVEEAWANKHFVTKNYSDITQVGRLEGGKNSETNTKTL